MEKKKALQEIEREVGLIPGSVEIINIYSKDGQIPDKLVYIMIDVGKVEPAIDLYTVIEKFKTCG